MDEDERVYIIYTALRNLVRVTNVVLA